MNDNQKQMRIYLALVLGVCYLLGIAVFLSGGTADTPAYQFLHKGFTAFPVLAAFFTRRITKDTSPLRLSLKVWKNAKLWLFSALVPALLIAVGAALYYVIFPAEYSGVFALGSLMGSEDTIPVRNPLIFAAVCVPISAVCIPIHLIELGEEIGWREYLLPKQIEQYGVQKAVLINGLEWGVAHLPLIYFGFNYSADNFGAPWSNIVMMLPACIVIGILCSYVMVKSDNAMYSAIIHGAVNIIGEIPVFLSVSQQSGLLGPNPTGVIGMAGMILCAVILIFRLGKPENQQIG